MVDATAAHESITKEEYDGLRLTAQQEELSDEQQLVRRATGALGWLAEWRIEAKPFAHRLQRVSRAPPPGALTVHKKIAANLLLDKHAGVSFPWMGPRVPVAPLLKLDGVAPSELQIVYDATWTDGVEPSAWQAAYTYNGAAFATVVGVISLTNLSSSDAESYSLSMALARGVVYQNVLVFFGAAHVGRTVVWGDNSAVVGLAANSQSPSGMRHVLRRIKHIQELTEERFDSRHVDDKNNVIDFFGKYVSGKKAALSVAYLACRQLQAAPRE